MQIGKPKRKKFILLKFDIVPKRQKTYPKIRTDFKFNLIKELIMSIKDMDIYLLKQYLSEKVADSAKKPNAIGKSKCLILYSRFKVNIYRKTNKKGIKLINLGAIWSQVSSIKNFCNSLRFMQIRIAEKIDIKIFLILFLKM